MAPTRRGVLLLLVPAGACALQAFVGGPATVVLVLVAATGLLLLDGTLGTRRALVARRAVEVRLSVGADAPVEVTLRAPGARRDLEVALTDGPPDALHPDRRSGAVVVPVGRAGAHRYVLRPDRRGSYLIDDPWVRLRGRLGLAWRLRRVPCASRVSVVPDIRALRSYDLLARRAMTREAGFRSLRRIGEGTEVERLREYLPGDDYRRIDWKATARRLRPITREMEAERRRHVVYVVDAGRWMAQPTGRLLKLDHALNTVLLAAHVADRCGDLTGVLTFSDRVLSWLPPASGRRHQARLLDELHTTPAEVVEPAYRTAFRHLAGALRKRALLILLSDFSDPTTAEELLRTLPVVSRRHLLLCVHLLDPDLEGLCGRSPTTVRDAHRRALAEKLRHERHRTLDHLRAQGARVLESPADRLTTETVNRYLEIKGRAEL